MQQIMYAHSKARTFWDVKHTVVGSPPGTVRIRRECWGAEKVKAPELLFGFIRSIQTHEPLGNDS